MAPEGSPPPQEPGWDSWIGGVRALAGALSDPGGMPSGRPAGWDPGRFPWDGEGRAVARWLEGGSEDPDAAARTGRLLEGIAPVLDLLHGREIGVVPLHGAHHLGVLYPGAGARPVEQVDLLVSPWDVARARLVLASRGLVPVTRGWKRIVLASGEVRLALHWGLVPRGFREAPLGPFLEDVEDGGERPLSPRMRPGAAWAAHRLLLARDLWRPSPRAALHLAETVALGSRVAEADRRKWTERARLWRLARLWALCDRMESWVLGGPRPPLADGPPRSPRERILRVASLQDGLSARLEVPVRWFWEGFRER